MFGSEEGFVLREKVLNNSCHRLARRCNQADVYGEHGEEIHACGEKNDTRITA